MTSNLLPAIATEERRDRRDERTERRRQRRLQRRTSGGRPVGGTPSHELPTLRPAVPCPQRVMHGGQAPASDSRHAAGSTPANPVDRAAALPGVRDVSGLAAPHALRAGVLSSLLGRTEAHHLSRALRLDSAPETSGSRDAPPEVDGGHDTDDAGRLRVEGGISASHLRACREGWRVDIVTAPRCD